MASSARLGSISFLMYLLTSNSILDQNHKQNNQSNRITQSAKKQTNLISTEEILLRFRNKFNSKELNLEGEKITTDYHLQMAELSMVDGTFITDKWQDYHQYIEGLSTIVSRITTNKWQDYLHNHSVSILHAPADSLRTLESPSGESILSSLQDCQYT